MKKKAWQAVGISAFWLSWPLLFWYLKGSQRSRILLVHGDDILVVKNLISSGKWQLPGGGLHAGETSLQGAIREIKEEIGLTLKAEQLRLLDSFNYHEHGFRFHYDVFVVELNDKPTFIPQQKEIAAVAWQPRSSLTKTTSGTDVLSALAAWFK